MVARPSQGCRLGNVDRRALRMVALSSFVSKRGIYAKGASIAKDRTQALRHGRGFHAES